MRKLIIALFILFISVSCTNTDKKKVKNNTFLSLQLREGAGREVKIFKLGANNQKPVDSIIISDDNTAFIAFPIDQESFFRIRNSQNNSITFLAKENDTATIEGNYFNFSEYKLGGSEENRQISLLNEKTQEFLKKIDQIAAITRDSAKSKNYANIKLRLDKEYRRSFEEFRKFSKKFIEDNKGSLVSMLALTNQLGYNFYTFHPVKDMDIFIETDSILYALYPNYEPVTELHRKITEIRNQHALNENTIDQPGKGKNAPELKLPGPNGQIVKLNSMQGNYILLNFWASWSPPCRDLNKTLIKLNELYKDQDLKIVQVSLDHSRDDWLEAIKKDSLEWIHASDLKHWDSKAVKLYGIHDIPVSFIIDKKGTIIASGLKEKKLTEKLKEIFN